MAKLEHEGGVLARWDLADIKNTIVANSREHSCVQPPGSSFGQRQGVMREYLLCNPRGHGKMVHEMGLEPIRPD